MASGTGRTTTEIAKKKKKKAATRRKIAAAAGCGFNKLPLLLFRMKKKKMKKTHDDDKRMYPRLELSRTRACRNYTVLCCNVCGGRCHTDPFCPYNYMHGSLGLMSTCCGGRKQKNCRTSPADEQHPTTTLRRFVRVTNVPWSLTERGLERLLEQFGPLLACELTRVRHQDRTQFGYATFQSREQAEEAIHKLNGHSVHGRKLRIDWAYPRNL